MQTIDDLSKLHQMGKKKTKDTLRSKSLVRIYIVFGQHYKKYWQALMLAYVSLLAFIAVEVLAPWPLKLIVDYLILDQPLPVDMALLQTMRAAEPKLLLLLSALSIVVLAVLAAFLSYVIKYWVSSIGAHMSADIRERVFAHLQRLSLSFHDSARSGNLAYLLTSDVKEMRRLLLDLPQEVCPAPGDVWHVCRGDAHAGLAARPPRAQPRATAVLCYQILWRRPANRHETKTTARRHRRVNHY